MLFDNYKKSAFGALARFVTLAVLGSASVASAQQSAYHQEVFTQARAGARIDTNGSGFHQIAWVTSGGPGACILSLDFSDDGMVWELGEILEMLDCTRSGSSPVANANVKFVRMNLNSLSPTAAVRATYTGFQSNPGPIGSVTSVFGRTGEVLAMTGDYNVSQITGAAPLFSPSLQGSPTSPNPPPGDNSNRIATTEWVIQHTATLPLGVTSFNTRTGDILPATGDYNFSQISGQLSPSQLPPGGLVNSFNTRTGAVLPQSGDYSAFYTPLAGWTTGTPVAPTAALSVSNTQIASTAFVHAAVDAGPSGGPTGVQSFNSRSGTVVPLVGDYSTFYAPIAGWTTGAPTAPTATAGTNTTQIASTAFVSSALSNLNIGVSTFNGRAGAVIPVVGDYSSYYAPIAGWSTGTPVAPTAPSGTNTNQIASTAFIHNIIYGGGTTNAIVPSAQAGECTGGATTTLTLSGLNILAGDTVFVAVAHSNSTTAEVTNVTVSDVNNVYFTRARLKPGPGTTGYKQITLLSTNPSAALPTSSITVNTGTSTWSGACVFTFKNIGSIDPTAQTGNATGVTSNSISVTTLNPDEVMLAAFTTFPDNQTLTITQGTEFEAFVPPATTSWGAIKFCTNTSATPAALTCGLTSSVNAGFAAVALRLTPSSTGGVVTSFNNRSGAVVPQLTDYSTFFAPIGGWTTGAPTAPTATAGTNTTQIASTAFVTSALSSLNVGVSSFNSRSGAVVPATGDYNVSEVTGAAPINNPHFTGTQDGVAPDPADSSTRLATTGWFRAQGYAPPPVVGPSAQAASCATGTPSGGTFSISGLNILTGDTVFVAVANATNVNTGNNDRVTDNASGGTSYYHDRAIYNPGANFSEAKIYSTDPGAAVAATTVTLTTTSTQPVSMCVLTRKQVGSLLTGPVYASSTGNTHNVSITTAYTNEVVFAAMVPVPNNSGTFQITGGNDVSQPGFNAIKLCERTAVIPGLTTCTMSTSASTYGSMVSIHMTPASVGSATQFPSTIKYGMPVVYSNGTGIGSTGAPFLLCNKDDCLRGFYRFSYYITTNTACTETPAVGAFRTYLRYQDNYTYANGNTTRDAPVMPNNFLLTSGAVGSGEYTFYATGMPGTSIQMYITAVPCTTGVASAAFIYSIERIR